MFPVKTIPLLFSSNAFNLIGMEKMQMACVSIFFKDKGWYLGVIGNFHNYECIIYVFTDEVLKLTPNIFNNSHYHYWYR